MYYGFDHTSSEYMYVNKHAILMAIDMRLSFLVALGILLLVLYYLITKLSLYFFLLQRKGEIQFWEAECIKLDAKNKQVICRSNINNNLVGNGEFHLEYDYLVMAVGAQVNTFNTPGVLENCYFLKVLPTCFCMEYSCVPQSYLSFQSWLLSFDP